MKNIKINKSFYIIILAMATSCHSQKTAISQSNFPFQIWRQSLLKQYDELISTNKSMVDKSLTNSELVRKEIEYVDQSTFLTILDSVKKENAIKNWTEMYVVYHFFEGEVNFSLSTFIFYRNTEMWGTTFDHSLKRYRNTSKIRQNEFDKLDSFFYGNGNGLFIVSKFNLNYQNIYNKIIIGASNNDNLPQIMKMYDKSVFD